jgi:hypothetical protein
MIAAIVDRLLTESKRAAERNKTAAAYGLLGALLGVALGLVGGRSGGSAHSGWRGALGGGLTAAVAGAALSWGLIPFMYRLQAAAQIADPDFASRFLQIHCLFHAVFAAGIGFAAGLALGWGSGDRTSLGRALIGGLFGALAGVFLFEMINTMSYRSRDRPDLSVVAARGSIWAPGGFSLAGGPDGPEDEANPFARSPRTRRKWDDLASMRGETPLPEERLARLAMYLCVAGGAALLAGLAADTRPRRSSPTSLAT